MKRWTLLAAGAALWLFLAAAPALADGGPHVADANSGVSTLTADSCAGCHRAHTAQGPMLINAPNEEALCLTCHGAASTGATTDVMTGVQYALGTDGLRSGAQLGALRGGGFDQARIGAGEVYRITTAARAIRTKVPVIATPENVTSAHIAMDENGLSLPGIAWGNGATSATPNVGPAATLSCASCHNPHGNGQYRILNPIPTAPGIAADTANNPVTDAALPPVGDTRNYTVIQRPVASAGGPALLASQVIAAGYPPLSGDYFHRGVWWDTRDNNDAPNGIPAGSGGAGFNDQITQWCSACHTRYYSTDDGTNDSGDAVFRYQHNTQSNRACTTCHVSHGSNASMAADPTTGTTFSQNAPYPNDQVSASSRLLKIDRRGTCQACHDPTGTFPASSSAGPVPNPLRP